MWLHVHVEPDISCSSGLKAALWFANLILESQLAFSRTFSARDATACCTTQSNQEHVTTNVTMWMSWRPIPLLIYREYPFPTEPQQNQVTVGSHFLFVTFLPSLLVCWDKVSHSSGWPRHTGKDACPWLPHHSASASQGWIMSRNFMYSLVSNTYLFMTQFS